EDRTFVGAEIIAAGSPGRGGAPRSADRSRAGLRVPLNNRRIETAFAKLVDQSRERELLDVDFDTGMPQLLLKQHRGLHADLVGQGNGNGEAKGAAISNSDTVALRHPPTEGIEKVARCCQIVRNLRDVWI